MLSGAPVPRPGAITWRSTVRAWPLTARGLPWPTLAAVLGMAAFPAVVLRLQGADDFSGAVIAATLLAGATAGYLVDDPAGETLSASPTSLARRRLLRLAALAVGVAATVAVILTAAATGAPVGSLPLADCALELLAVAGLAAGAAGLAHRSSGATAAPIGAVAGTLGVLVISSLAYRFSTLPSVASSSHHERWWLVAIAGWATAAWTSRDLR